VDDTLHLDDLPPDPEAPDGDPGRDWHPAKAEAFDADGLLPDLTDEEVAEHLEKPEGREQVDGVQRLVGTGSVALAAEDSLASGPEAV
jgi:hypothetical protein